MTILPLLVVLITAEIYVDRLTKKSQKTIIDAAHVVQSSSALAEQITTMERNALQYTILQDPALYEVYVNRRREFQQTVNEMQQLVLNNIQESLLQKLVLKEQQIFEHLNQITQHPQSVNYAMEEFQQLGSLAHSIFDENSKLIEQHLDQIKQETDGTQRLLLLQSLTLVPAAVVLSILFIILIAKPLRQIDHAIRQLGDGKFESEISIEGPDDLRELGRQLNWMRSRLLELENQKIAFLRHVSHELKTPLTSIREGSELLNDQIIGSLNEKQLEIVQLLKENSLRLQKLIEDLLSFSSASSKRIPLQKIPFQLGQIIQKVVKGQKLSTDAKSLSVDVFHENINFFGDREKIRTIIDNLLSNAVKYSPTGGKIRLSLIREGNNAILDIRDQGPGIPQNERTKIFEPFYQGKTAFRGYVKGTGMGLAIVREYVNAHKGAIEVIDGEQGAHFRISLPISMHEQ